MLTNLQPSSLQLGDYTSLIYLIVIIAIIVAAFFYLLVWALSKRPLTGVESLKGKTGVVVSDLVGKEIGEVSVDGVIWKAKIADDKAAEQQRIGKGEQVVVVGISSLVLLVQRHHA